MWMWVPALVEMSGMWKTAAWADQNASISVCHGEFVCRMPDTASRLT